MRILVACAAALAIAGAAQAEIVKTAKVNCNTGEICLYWWPKLPELRGWHGGGELNFKMGSNGSAVLIPDGRTFSDAPAVIYARAIYIERYDWQNKTKSTLASFIQDDKATFREEAPNTAITSAAPLTTGDGQPLEVAVFSRPKSWDCVAYGKEDGYYLMFVMSANSEAAFQEAKPVFQDLVSRYRK